MACSCKKKTPPQPQTQTQSQPQQNVIKESHEYNTLLDRVRKLMN